MTDKNTDQLTVLLGQISNGQNNMQKELSRFADRLTDIEKSIVSTDDLKENSIRLVESLEQKMVIHNQEAKGHSDRLHNIAMAEIANVKSDLRLNGEMSRPSREVFDKIRDIALGVIVAAILGLIIINR